MLKGKREIKGLGRRTLWKQKKPREPFLLKGEICVRSLFILLEHQHLKHNFEYQGTVAGGPQSPHYHNA